MDNDPRDDKAERMIALLQMVHSMLEGFIVDHRKAEARGDVTDEQLEAFRWWMGELEELFEKMRSTAQAGRE